jgi:hypothetical protein
MNAEDIVRALAGTDPVFHGYHDDFRCALCNGESGPADEMDVHAHSCPWLLACEWVAEHGGVSVGSPPHGHEGLTA